MTIKIEQIKDFTAFTYANELHEFCKSIFSATPVQGCQFYRLFPDHTRIHLSTDAKWVDVFYNKNLHEFANLHSDPNSYQPGSYIWDFWDYNSDSYEKCGKIAVNEFDHAHGISIVRKHTNYTDIFEMAGSKYNFSLNEFYLNNIDLLNRLADSFYQHAAPILKRAEQNRLYIPTSANAKAQERISNINTALIIANKLPPTHTRTFYQHLSAREKECLLWLMRGKTGPEIAIILNISPRTAEKHIGNLKSKFNCSSLFQMGVKLADTKQCLFLEEAISLHSK